MKLILALAILALPAHAQSITHDGGRITAIDCDLMVVSDATGRLAAAELLTGHRILEPSQAASDAGEVSMILPPGEYTATAFSIPQDRMDPNRDEVVLALTVEDPTVANLERQIAWWRSRWEAQRAFIAKKNDGLNWWKARALAAEGD